MCEGITLTQFIVDQGNWHTGLLVLIGAYHFGCYIGNAAGYIHLGFKGEL